MYQNRYTPVHQVPPTLAVRFYKNVGGRQPVAEWLRGMDRATRQAIGADIKTVEIGWPLGMPLVRKLDAGLWEVRSHIPDGIARVFFTTVDTTMVLLHAIIKKSDKTPGSDLAIAKTRRDEVKHANR